MTTQIAPTVLQLLGLNPLALDAVVQERTALLPGFEPVQAAINSPFKPFTVSLNSPSVGHLVNGQAQFQLSGTEVQHYLLEASSEMQHWVPLSTNRLVISGTLTLRDPQAPLFTNRFYRAMLQP